MRLFNYFRISKPSEEKVPEEKVATEYERLRRRTFWSATAGYSLYYMCRLSLSVIKQPLIDDGVLSATQLGVIGSSLFFVYAIGKCLNGFMADYCNARRFMAVGLIVSAIINLVMGLMGASELALGISSTTIFVSFALLWGFNGWFQSMGSPPGVISLSRWFPLSSRGTYYSIFSATPYIGECLSFVVVGYMVSRLGWHWGFLFSSMMGFVGAAIILLFVTDTPESKGLPRVQELYGEEEKKEDKLPTREIQKLVLRHPGIWIIALSSAFIYITKYAVAGWGVLFLQKSKDIPLESASQVIGLSAFFGVLGTVLAGWLSDKVFKGDRIKPVMLSGIVSLAALAAFLLTGGGYVLNAVYISLCSLAVGVLYCIVAGLMAVDIVPRRATGAALGIVGISCYVAAGVQDLVSGLLVDRFTVGGEYNFLPVSIFWLVASLLSFVLPVLNWKSMKQNTIQK